MLLQPKQTSTTRFLRIALIPTCIYLSCQVNTLPIRSHAS